MSRFNIEAKLLATPVDQLDLSDFCIVTSDSTVKEAVARMRASKHNCAFIVGGRTQIIGIFTDRDVLKKIANNPAIWEAPITEQMTPNPVTLPPESSTGDALALMQKHHFRNIPVVDEHTVYGNITYYAVLKFLSDHVPEAVYNLPPDPDHYAEDRVGG